MIEDSVLGENPVKLKVTDGLDKCRFNYGQGMKK